MRNTDRTLPIRSLLHPLWLAALVLLVVNDHVLKHAGVMSPWLVGKLSDFAGLIVAPAVVAVALRLATRRGLLRAHLAVGAIFAAINLAPAVARAFEALTGLTPLPWQITVDPTDLLALPALLVSWRVLVPAMERPGVSPWPGRLLFGAGALACMATSPPDEPDPDLDVPAPEISGSLGIGNATESPQILRVRPLRDGIRMDCNHVAEAPTQMLSPALFASATAWTVEPNGVLPIAGFGFGGTDCVAFLVDGVGLDPVMLFYSSSTYSVTSLPGFANQASGNRIILLQASGDALGLSGHPALFPAPSGVDVSPAPGCEVPGEGEGVAWSKPLPIGDKKVVSVDTSPDGCSAIGLLGATAVTKWYLCVPGVALPFGEGDDIRVSSLEQGQTGLDISGIEVEAGGRILRVGHGSDIVQVGALDVTVAPIEGCAGVHDECGSLVEPVMLVLEGEAAPLRTLIRAGQLTELTGASGNPGYLFVIRAQTMPVADTTCTPEAKDSALVLDTVYME